MSQEPVDTSTAQIKILGEHIEACDEILTAGALEFLAQIHAKFDATRLDLLEKRQARQKDFDAGELPEFLAETRHIRDGDWQTAPVPADIQDRRIEITGPVDRKMVINALNSGAKCFMADFEDATSPTWSNIIEGQLNVRDALRRDISLDTPEGKSYRLRDDAPLAKILVRPRGLHLDEKHLTCNGARISGAFADFALFAYHNQDEHKERGNGLYFYIPKLESHLEARLWNDIFTFTEDQFDLPRGTIRVTVLIETLPAAFEMDEILYELRDHSIGLNAGRWDYIFSAIKRLKNHKEMVLPNRGDVTMGVAFMKSYAETLVKTCHKRGTFAMGGMAAFIPSRKDPAVNEKAIPAVTADKKRESEAGFDGTWVAHPDLIPVALEQFDAVLGDKPNQIDKQRNDIDYSASDLLSLAKTPGKITMDGVRLNINVALQYINWWLKGLGAVAIHNLMEDAATAEISRAQLWQWIKSSASCDDGTEITADLYKDIAAAELQALKQNDQAAPSRYDDAAEILDTMVLSEDFEEFLTLPAYEKL